jgi:hypothetical protein
MRQREIAELKRWRVMQKCNQNSKAAGAGLSHDSHRQ